MKLVTCRDYASAAKRAVAPLKVPETAARDEKHPCAYVDRGGFTLVSNKRKARKVPRKSQCGTAKPDKTISLQAAIPGKALYVSRLNYSTTANDLVEYVVKKTKLKLRVLQLRPRHYVHFYSFVVRVPQPLLETMEREDFLPKGVVFRRFRGNLQYPTPERTTQQRYSEVSSK